MTDRQPGRGELGHRDAIALGVTGVLLFLPGLCAVFFTQAVSSALFPRAVTLRIPEPSRAIQTIADGIYDAVWVCGIVSVAAGVVLITVGILALILGATPRTDQGVGKRLVPRTGQGVGKKLVPRTDQGVGKKLVPRTDQGAGKKLVPRTDQGAGKTLADRQRPRGQKRRQRPPMDHFRQ